jgi:hypothetical protein
MTLMDTHCPVPVGASSLPERYLLTEDEIRQSRGSTAFAKGLPDQVQHLFRERTPVGRRSLSEPFVNLRYRVFHDDGWHGFSSREGACTRDTAGTTLAATAA